MHGIHRIGLLLGVMMTASMAGCEDDELPLVATSEAIELSVADLSRARLLIAEHGCVACHTVPGVSGPHTRVGPPLEALEMRGYIGGVLPNTPDNLAKWLLDPPVIDPLTAMPDTGLSHEEARIIAAYLLGHTDAGSALP